MQFRFDTDRIGLEFSPNESREAARIAVRLEKAGIKYFIDSGKRFLSVKFEDQEKFKQIIEEANGNDSRKF